MVRSLIMLCWVVSAGLCNSIHTFSKGNAAIKHSKGIGKIPWFTWHNFENTNSLFKLGSSCPMGPWILCPSPGGEICGNEISSHTSLTDTGVSAALYMFDWSLSSCTKSVRSACSFEVQRKRFCKIGNLLCEAIIWNQGHGKVKFSHWLGFCIWCHIVP